MRIAAVVFALLAQLLLAGCGGGEVTTVEPAGIGATEPDRPVAD